MGKLRILLIVFGFMLTFVAMTISIDKMRESKATIETLENDLAREKANHKSVKEDRKKAEDKVYELNAKVNDLEIEVGALQEDLAVERENHTKTKADSHSKDDVVSHLTGEVDKLKKLQASTVNKLKKVEPKEQVQAKPSEANEGGRKIDMRVTAYGADCIGCEGKTASGTDYTKGRTLACPPQYKFGTKIHIPELGGTYICEDRGGAIKGNTFDMFHGNSEAATTSFGVKYVTGYIRE
jgi:3D (Asp-Asp-Asp) domain-containing protein